MSTTGDLTIVDKTHDQVIPVGTTQTAIRFDGVESFEVPEGRTIFQLQVYATFSNTVAQRPNRVIVQLCRYRPDGSKDPTGKCVRAVMQPGTTSWADVFTDLEYAAPEDGKFGYTISHNGASPIKLTTKILKAHNPAAYAAARLTPAVD